MFRLLLGGDKRDRTADLLNAIQALSQLSYTPIFGCAVSFSARCILPEMFRFVNSFFKVFRFILHRERWGRTSGAPAHFHGKPPQPDGLRRFVGSIELLAILAGGLRLLAALDAGALVMLALTDLSQDTRLGTAALEALQSALQRLVLSHTDFRHLYFPPSGAAGRPLPRKGHIYGFNSNIIFISPPAVKRRFMNML